ncbi:hypothetical protein N665_2873s0002 [Sinapis alba]|nr:hypothetical protein N665_2873s0002 [Sinapis alba]
MLGTRVVAAGIVVILIVNLRKSFTGTTMVNFLLFTYMVLHFFVYYLIYLKLFFVQACSRICPKTFDYAVQTKRIFRF